MDEGLSIPEELRSGGCDSDGIIFEINEYKKDDDVFPILYILNEFWKNVNQEDLWDWVDVELHGVNVTIQKVELQLYRYIHEGCRVITASTTDGVMLGVIVGIFALPEVLGVRALYVHPDVRTNYVSNELVNAFGKVSTIVFQTLKKNHPTYMFDRFKNAPVKMGEDDKLSTWFIRWDK